MVKNFTVLLLSASLAVAADIEQFRFNRQAPPQ